MRPPPAAVLAVLLPAAVLLAVAPDPEPAPPRTAEEVVRIQVEALGANDHPPPDRGIALASRFTSPINRAATGPLPRFAAGVKGPAYADRLDVETAATGAIAVDGDRAARRVTLAHADGRPTCSNCLASPAAPATGAG